MENIFFIANSQQKQNICLPTNVLLLFIQAAGLAYHHRAKRGAYHQPLWGCISSRASVHLPSENDVGFATFYGRHHILRPKNFFTINKTQTFHKKIKNKRLI